jgi:hypothetical protein
MDNQDDASRATAALALFERALQQRNVSFQRLDDALYAIVVGEANVSVSLQNVARDFVRDGDEGAILRFVERCLVPVAIPDWATATHHVYFSAERSDHEFGDVVCRNITRTVTRVLVVTSSDEAAIMWISRSQQAKWNVTLDQLEMAARTNLDALLSGKKLEIMEAAGRKLGMLPVDSALKASLIFAPGLRRFVEPELGWPVLAVVPCRDFIYLLAERDGDFLGNLGAVVQREFRTSGYPITTEVLRISDQGVEAIGAFPE